MAKYLKMNSKKGYIEDTAEIAHVKFNNMRHVILGCMLGDFDNNGEYFVSPEIVAELINMDKHIIESIDNIDICESFLKLDKPITFAITFQNDKATLSLLEKMNHGANFKLNSGAYSDINEYVLAEVETSGAVDKNAVYRMWNVKLSGGEALDVFHMDPETLAKFAGVVRRFKYLLAANKLLLKKEEKIEEIESAYFNKLMKVLARYPKLKVAVEKEIKNQLDEKTGMFRLDKPNAMKTMNEIIEDAIEDNLEVLTEEEQENFNVEKHNVENEYNIEITKEVDIKTEKIEQKDINADPIVVPVIETFGEEDKKTVEELGKEFVEEENIVEKQCQDDMVTFATGGKIPENKEEKNSEVEESKNLIVESIKGDDNEVKKNNEETVELSDFQRACIAAASKHKKGQENQSDDNVNNMPGAQKRKAIQGIIGIRLEKEVVYTPTGPATVESTEVTAVVKEEKNGKKTTLVLSQKGLKATIKGLTGNETQLKIQETQAQVVAKVDDKTNDKMEEKTTEKEQDKKLIIKKVEEEKKKTNTKINVNPSGSGGGGSPNKTGKNEKQGGGGDSGGKYDKDKKDRKYYYVGNTPIKQETPQEVEGKTPEQILQETIAKNLEEMQKDNLALQNAKNLEGQAVGVGKTGKLEVNKGQAIDGYKTNERTEYLGTGGEQHVPKVNVNKELEEGSETTQERFDPVVKGFGE